jgi:AcrR family transcriptional regulator
MGLREEKKRATRETIAAAAMRLFQEHGYDAVTVADVAKAANVSEKTVFNYFSAKEDLVFHRGAELRDALLESVRNLPPGATLVEPFRRLTREMLDRIEDGPPESVTAVPRLVQTSAALRDRVMLSWEQEAVAVAEAAGLPAGDILSGVIVRSLSWTHRLTFRAAFRRLLAGEDGAAVAADLRPQVERAYDELEGAFFS